MRARVSWAVALGLVVYAAANAQAPEGEGAPIEDFFGVYVAAIYVAVPDVTEPDVIPFTPAGERAFNAYDVFATAANQADDCAPESMPGILWSGDPKEIIQEDGRIVFHYERRNTLRTIHMGEASPPADQPYTQLGYSVGRWTGAELRVETTHMLDGVVRSNRGYPISREGRVTERYWREPGSNILHMELIVDDPVNYTDTLTFGRDWVRSRDDVVRPWECVSLGPRDSEPDIDELVRMLEEL